MMRGGDYRADIDGLRALAVLSVMFYHVGFGAFGGGYVGVDVFFVISGFLITRLIRDEVQRGTFRFANFYVRRARRLLPALFFTFAATFAAAFLSFSPRDLQLFGGSLVHAVASISNFYFWSEAGYFDAASSVKPLLHTWSLSVEEQFYLVWPACLLLLLTKTPRVTLPIVLVVAGLGSLLLNVDLQNGDSALLAAVAPGVAGWFSDGPATIYYLAPFRVFEFALGAGVVWLVAHPPKRGLVAESLSFVGLALIAVPMLVYNEETLFPSVNALPPCIGTALLIYARTADHCRRVLSNRLVVRLGLISYSLYLAHWPILVFYRYHTNRELTAAEAWAICALSVVVAEAMYRWVETPARRGGSVVSKWSPAGFGLACALCALGLSIAGASAWANRGWTWRFGGGKALQEFGRIEELRRERGVFLMGQRAAQFRADTTNILVVGDSLAGDLVAGLAVALGEGFDVQQDRYHGLCHGVLAGGEPLHNACEGILEGLQSSLKIPAADHVFISFRHSASFHPAEFVPLVKFLERRVKPGARIALFGRRPEFPGFQAVAVAMLAKDPSLQRVEAKAREFTADDSELDRQMRAAAEQLGIDFISNHDIFCSAGRARYFTEDGSLMFWDKNHMTIDGAKWYGAQVVARIGDIQKRGGVRPQSAGPGREPQRQAGSTMALGEAEEILRSLGTLLARTELDGNTVLDASRLPHSKERLKAAVLRIVEDHPDRGQCSFARSTGLVLAFFQPGVGESPVGMDAVGENGQRWRQLVEAEMQEIEAAFMARDRSSGRSGR